MRTTEIIEQKAQGVAPAAFEAADDVPSDAAALKGIDRASFRRDLWRAGSFGAAAIAFGALFQIASRSPPETGGR